METVNISEERYKELVEAEIRNKVAINLITTTEYLSASTILTALGVNISKTEESNNESNN